MGTGPAISQYCGRRIGRTTYPADGATPSAFAWPLDKLPTEPCKAEIGAGDFLRQPRRPERRTFSQGDHRDAVRKWPVAVDRADFATSDDSGQSQFKRPRSQYVGLRLHLRTMNRKLRVMDFEILGDITFIRTIAVGNAIRELRRFGDDTGKGDGES